MGARAAQSGAAPADRESRSQLMLAAYRFWVFESPRMVSQSLLPALGAFSFLGAFISPPGVLLLRNSLLIALHQLTLRIKIGYWINGYCCRRNHPYDVFCKKLKNYN